MKKLLNAKQMLQDVLSGKNKAKDDAVSLLEALIVETCVGIVEMTKCEEEVKYVLKHLGKEHREQVASSIIILNTWIQQVGRMETTNKTRLRG